MSRVYGPSAIIQTIHTFPLHISARRVYSLSFTTSSDRSLYQSIATPSSAPNAARSERERRTGSPPGTALVCIQQWPQQPTEAEPTLAVVRRIDRPKKEFHNPHFRREVLARFLEHLGLFIFKVHRLVNQAANERVVVEGGKELLGAGVVAHLCQLVGDCVGAVCCQRSSGFGG